MNEVEAHFQERIVLVHGGLVDGSDWEDVYHILKKERYRVRIVQIPSPSVAEDVAFTRRVIAELRSSVVLCGHSYGEAVISEAGMIL